MRNLSAQDRAQINEALSKLRSGGHLHGKKATPNAAVRGGAVNRAGRPGAPRLDNSVIETIERFRERRNQPHYWAVKVDAEGEVVPARGNDLRSSGSMRHVLVVPTGYTADDYQKFIDGFNKMVSDMGNLPEQVFTSKYRDRIVYIAHWLPGGTIDSGDANFSPTLYEHPVRGGRGISMNNRELIEAVDNFKAEHLSTSDPIGVMVVFNIDDDDVTANAVCPTFLGKPYGIARITHEDIIDDFGFATLTWGHYVPMHELGHGAINWLDEYIEDMLDGWDINTTDPLTGLLLPDGTWQGWNDAWETAISNYTIRTSEVLADNGSDNISLRRTTSRVDSPDFDALVYESSGGMFFPIGTRHDEGNNVMNDSLLPDGETPKADGNRFAWDHSPQQDRLLDFVFGVTSEAPRPNDRIRCAGPMHNWLPQWGDQVRLLIFDADKNHRWHKTTKYEVEIGWWEWDWGRGDWAWRTMTRNVTPSARDVDLSQAIAGDGLGVLRDVLVANGVSDIPTGENASFNLAALSVEELVTTSLPAVKWPTPYQDVRVTLPIPAYQYYWRFRTYNGHHWSGFTGWSGFFKI
jgi:hypothetical protein